MNLINTRVFHSALVLIVLSMSACGGGGGSGSVGSSTTSSARTAASDALFTAAASAVNVTVVTDAARAASQVVDSSGGTLSATAADGSQFTLVIPASAVQQATTITMTPISSVAGLPLNGFVAGVQFAPDGLLLEKEATLTIVPSASLPVGDQTFLGYSGSGNDLHLVPPASPGNAIQMLIGHFSGSMLGSGTPAQRAAFYLSRAQDAEARLDQELARVLGEERQLQLLGTSDGTAVAGAIDSYFASYWDLVIQSYVAAANTSCANAKLAQRAYLGFERKYQLMGSTNPYDSNGAVYQQILNDIDTICSTLPNSYAGTFTYSGATGDTASGTVTFRRDDAACQVAGEYTATTACYVAESVTYTATPAPMSGCTLSQTSYTVSLSNTPASDAYLRVDLAPTNGAHFYHINALWMQTVSPPLTVTCGTFSWDPGYSADAQIVSGQTDPSAADVQKLIGGFTFSGMTYSWSLTGGS